MKIFKYVLSGDSKQIVIMPDGATESFYGEYVATYKIQSLVYHVFDKSYVS